MGDSAVRRDTSVHSVNRAVSILQTLARRGPTAVTDLASELHIHKSTISRLLTTLEARGLVDQTSNRGKYQLGYGIVLLAAGATRQLDLSVASQRSLQSLADEVGESVELAVLDEGAVLTIAQVVSDAGMSTVNWVGRRFPLHASAAGKILLAHMSDDERAARLTGPLERFTPDTITSRSHLIEQLDTARRDGYAYVLAEAEIGLTAVAAPIRNQDAEVVASITVSGPIFRLNSEKVSAVATHVMRAATEISQRLGQSIQG